MKHQQRKLVAALSLYAAIFPNLASAIAISGQGTWESTLLGRDLDGNLATAEAFFDTSLNITWLADVRYYSTSYEVLDPEPLTWPYAMIWVENLNPYGSGIRGWRLPVVRPIDGDTSDDTLYAYDGSEDAGTNISAPGTLYAGSTASEMAHMFYNTLGNTSLCDPVASTADSCVEGRGRYYNAGPFSQFDDDIYWSATAYSLDADYTWAFDFFQGGQYRDRNDRYGGRNLTWAVHDGDVGAPIPSAIPVPAAAWLFGSGLLGLVGVAKRKRRM